MIGQPEVVVGAEVQDTALGDENICVLRAQKLSLRFMEAFGADARQLLADDLFEGGVSHELTSTYVSLEQVSCLRNEDDLCALACSDEIEPLGNLAVGARVRPDGLDVQSCREAPGQPIPGPNEPPAGDPVYADALKDDVVCKIAGNRAGGDAKKRNSAAVFNGIEGEM